MVNRSARTRTLLAACAALSLWSCSGSGTDDAPRFLPELTLLSPGAADTDASTATLRGTANRPLVELTVGGVSATTTDQFLTWEAEVPLTQGINRLRIEGRTPDGQEPRPITVDRFVPRFLVPQSYALAADPDADRLLAITPGSVLGASSFWGPGIDAWQLDLDAGLLTVEAFPNDAYEETPAISLLAASAAGTRLDFALRGRNMAEPTLSRHRAHRLTFGSGTTRVSDDVLELLRRVATGRNDEFVAVWSAGLGTTDGDGQNRQLWAPTDSSFEPGPLTRGPDESTVYTAHPSAPVLWRCRRSGAPPEVVTSDQLGSGPSLGIVDHLAYLATTDVLLAATDAGLMQVDLRTGDRRLLDDSTDTTGLVVAAGEVFALDGYGRIERVGFPPSGGAVRTPLQERRTTSWVDWNSVIAIDHDGRADRIAFVDGIGSGWFDLATGTAERKAALPGLSAPAAIDAISGGAVAYRDTRVQGTTAVTLVDRDGIELGPFPADGELLQVALNETDFQLVMVERPTTPGDTIQARSIQVAFPGLTGRVATWEIPAPPSTVYAAGRSLWGARESGRNPLENQELLSALDFATGFSYEYPRAPISRFQSRALFYGPQLSGIGLATHDEVVVLERSSGVWKRISGGDVGSGPRILEPRLACVVEGRDAIVVVDDAYGGLFWVDLLTGERLLLDW